MKPPPEEEEDSWVVSANKEFMVLSPKVMDSPVKLISADSSAILNNALLGHENDDSNI